MLSLIKEIGPTQTRWVEQWHLHPPTETSPGFMRLVQAQHYENFQLWHEEDLARNPRAGDTEIAAVKRHIDQFNQKRNDLIEKLDESLLEMLHQQTIQRPNQSPINSETPGSMIDRCSIMALRIFHMVEQTQRTDVNLAHKEQAARKVQVLQIQRFDLLNCITSLLDEVLHGTRQFKLYRQYKMYNDPTLNPAVYSSETKTP